MVGRPLYPFAEVSEGVERVEVCVPAHIHSNQAAVLADLTRRKRKKRIFLKIDYLEGKEKAKAGWNL